MLLLFCLGCSTLSEQRRMGALVRAALRVCKQDGQRCAAARRCARAAVRAGVQLQQEREQLALGLADAAPAPASGLPTLADATCRAEGIQP